VLQKNKPLWGVAVAQVEGIGLAEPAVDSWRGRTAEVRDTVQQGQAQLERAMAEASAKLEAKLGNQLEALKVRGGTPRLGRWSAHRVCRARTSASCLGPRPNHLPQSELLSSIRQAKQETQGRS
jgi:hypothetical protein